MQTLIDNFEAKEKTPHIAISVDMLDTGIDVPEAVNLVFFKLVRSKTKFWQMVGRGTRLCPDLFRPGQHKKFFYIFDYCQNLEFFSQNPDTTDGATAESLSKMLFNLRLELISAIDDNGSLPDRIHETKATYEVITTEEHLRNALAEILQQEVAAMNVNNFVVRPQRKLVEIYSQPEAWKNLTIEKLTELAQGLAGLPSELTDEDEEAKRFDLLMLRLQLALLRSEPGFERLRKQVRLIAGLLEEKSSIPMVAAQMPLIQDIQSDEWWENVTTPILENTRKRLRGLIKLIEKASRKPIYSNFEDEIGAESFVELPGFGADGDFEKFRAKARHFLREHENDVTIHKLRWNMQLTAGDLQNLEQIMLEAGIGSLADFEKAKKESQGLGIFIRSLVGLDREAAKQAFGTFITEVTASANQIEFINLIIDHLTEYGVMAPNLLYESPFTDISPRGPEGVFTSDKVDEIITLLNEIREKAALVN